MSLNTWLLFLALVVTVIVMPGPAAALCISHGVSHGRIKALATVTGLILSSVALVALSLAGLGAILTTSGTLFNIVKFTGAAYLIYLGVKMWRLKPTVPSPATSQDNATVLLAANFSTLLRTGFFVGVSNPKDLLFFGALFPQFITPGSPLMPQVIIMTMTWCTVGFIVMAAYAAIGAGMAKRVNALNSKGVLDRITGGIFIIAGTALAWAKRSNA
jgi:threonine/homoserine/homoserine lactone efflux protein